MKTSSSVPDARERALQALIRHEEGGAFLNLVLPTLTADLDHRDRALARRLSLGVVQHLNTLDWALALFCRRPLETLTSPLRNLLRLGAYQLLYLDRVPDHAAVSQAVRLAHRYGHRGVAGLVNAVLRRLAGGREKLPWPSRRREPLTYLALRCSHPPWIVQRALERWGFDEAWQWCQANNELPPPTVRLNPLRSDAASLAVRLAREGLPPKESSLIPGVFHLPSGSAPAQGAAFREGLYSVQGESAALVAPLLNPGPGETIIDLCSAPGGKSAHLAELAGDQGRVYALDRSASRLDLVRKTARRLGLTSIRTLEADGRRVDHLKAYAPRAVLVDAPCSALGIIRRRPEIKWRRRAADLPALQTLQLELLASAAALLPPGGRLLYSVCSTEPEETEEVAARFARHHPHFLPRPLPDCLPLPLRAGNPGPAAFTWPHRHGLDGFFMALWQRGS